MQVNRPKKKPPPPTQLADGEGGSAELLDAVAEGEAAPKAATPAKRAPPAEVETEGADADGAAGMAARRHLEAAT